MTDHGRKPFKKKIKVRAILVSDGKDFAIFGASDNDDQDSYSHLVAGEWQEDVINDAAVVVEFELELSSRQMEVLRPVGKTKSVWFKPRTKP